MTTAPPDVGQTRFASAMVGLISVPVLTVAVYALNLLLPPSISWAPSLILGVGSPVTWLTVAIWGARNPLPIYATIVLHVCYYSVLGGAIGYLFWKRYGPTASEILVHGVRLTLLSWACALALAFPMLGLMALSGVH